MSKQPEPRKALGKGLSALLPQRAAAAPAIAPQNGLHEIALTEIEPNRAQPRTVFDQGKIEELAASIRANGVIQPLIVQRDGERYRLVAGERRYRAAQVAGLTHVPAVVREYAADRILEIALIENVQREDLNPIETAQAFDRLCKEYGLSHEQIAERTGKDRTTITNLLRLLKLPPDVQDLVAESRLSMGHAKALLSLPTPELQLQVAGKVVANQLSVRKVEQMVQEATRPPEPAAAEPEKPEVDPNVRAAVEALEMALGTRVRITPQTEQRGRIEIEYYSQEELNRLYEQIVGK